MSAYEISTVVISIIAILISIAARKSAQDANTKSDRQAKVSTLNNIFVNIDAARGRMEDHSANMAHLASKEDRDEAEEAQLDILNSILDSRIEGLLNAYDDACQRYLAPDDVDKADFKSKYQHSIKEIVEKYPEKFRDPVTRFKNLVAVYREWYP